MLLIALSPLKLWAIYDKKSIVWMIDIVIRYIWREKFKSSINADTCSRLCLEGNATAGRVSLCELYNVSCSFTLLHTLPKKDIYISNLYGKDPPSNSSQKTYSHDTYYNWYKENWRTYPLMHYSLVYDV